MEGEHKYPLFNTMIYMPLLTLTPSLNLNSIHTTTAPASYVAGLGRGAAGFTTRSDIGPAREGPTSSEAAAAAAARGAEKSGGGRGGDDDDDDDGRYKDPDDETGLFAGTPYDADDQEADNIYEAVEKKMDERRRARREKREQEEAERIRKERPPIQEQFADLKRGLSEMTNEEWASLPEVMNLTGKRRKKMEDRFSGRSFVVPDSVIAGARDANSYESSLDEKQMVSRNYMNYVAFAPVTDD